MSPEDRRKAFERMLARMEARGYQFESDPGFLASVEGWIDGKIEIADLQTIYVGLLRSRQHRLDE